MTITTAVSICASVLLGIVVVLTSTAILVICRRFHAFPTERNYLLYFSWTMLGFILLLTHQTVWTWDAKVSENYWSWILFLLGENLIVTPEMLRAARLLVIYYGYPALTPWPVWRDQSNVNPTYLRTRYLMTYLLLLQVPVIVLWLCMAITESLVFEYISLVYTAIQIVVLLVSVTMLRYKREEMEKHQLSESRAVLIFGVGVFFFVLFDSIRVIAGEENYTDISSAWVIIDLVSIAGLVILALAIWSRHYHIIHSRLTAKEKTAAAKRNSGSISHTPRENSSTNDSIMNTSLPNTAQTALTQSQEKAFAHQKTMKANTAHRPQTAETQSISNSMGGADG